MRLRKIDNYKQNTRPSAIFDISIVPLMPINL